MITESDIKALKTGSSKLYRVTVLTVFPFCIVVLLVCGVANVLLSARFAEIAGMTMVEVMKGWFTDFSVSEQYSGAFLKALERFECGVLQILGAVWIAVMMLIGLRRHRRDARILKFIEERK